MNINQQHALRCAVQNPEAAAKTFNKVELYDALSAFSETIRKSNESAFQARVRATTATSEGRALMKAYDLAPKAKPLQKSAPSVSPEEFRKAMPGGDALTAIEATAKKIAASENVSMIKARALAWERNPNLKAEYDNSASRARIISGGRA